MAVGCLGPRRRSRTERVLLRVPGHERGCSSPGDSGQHVLPAQDHQPVHGGSAAGLCLGSLDDLRDRRLCLGRSQDRGLQSPSPIVCDKAILPGSTARRATMAGMPAAASTTWSTRARWSTCSSASNINISMSARRMRSASIPAAVPATGWDEDLSAKGDIVRARLTIKTHGLPLLLLTKLCERVAPQGSLLGLRTLGRIEPPAEGSFCPARGDGIPSRGGAKTRPPVLRRRLGRAHARPNTSRTRFECWVSSRTRPNLRAWKPRSFPSYRPSRRPWLNPASESARPSRSSQTSRCQPETGRRIRQACCRPLRCRRS